MALYKYTYYYYCYCYYYNNNNNNNQSQKRDIKTIRLELLVLLCSIITHQYTLRCTILHTVLLLYSCQLHNLRCAHKQVRRGKRSEHNHYIKRRLWSGWMKLRTKVASVITAQQYKKMYKMYQN